MVVGIGGAQRLRFREAPSRDSGAVRSVIVVIGTGASQVAGRYGHAVPLSLRERVGVRGSRRRRGDATGRNELPVRLTVTRQRLLRPRFDSLSTPPRFSRLTIPRDGGMIV